MPEAPAQTYSEIDPKPIYASPLNPAYQQVGFDTYEARDEAGEKRTPDPLEPVTVKTAADVIEQLDGKA
jgi:hypothetical protein